MRSHAVSLMCSNTKCYARPDTRMYVHAFAQAYRLGGFARAHTENWARLSAEVGKFARTMQEQTEAEFSVATYEPSYRYNLIIFSPPPIIALNYWDTF